MEAPYVQRVALTKAISEGERQFERGGGGPELIHEPLRICRQFMAEFGLDVPSPWWAKAARVTMTVKELLPDAFTEALK